MEREVGDLLPLVFSRLLSETTKQMMNTRFRQSLIALGGKYALPVDGQHHSHDILPNSRVQKALPLEHPLLARPVLAESNVAHQRACAVPVLVVREVLALVQDCASRVHAHQ